MWPFRKRRVSKLDVMKHEGALAANEAHDIASRLNRDMDELQNQPEDRIVAQIIASLQPRRTGRQS